MQAASGRPPHPALSRAGERGLTAGWRVGGWMVGWDAYGPQADDPSPLWRRESCCRIVALTPLPWRERAGVRGKGPDGQDAPDAGSLRKAAMLPGSPVPLSHRKEQASTNALARPRVFPPRLRVCQCGRRVTLPGCSKGWSQAGQRSRQPDIEALMGLLEPAQQW